MEEKGWNNNRRIVHLAENASEVNLKTRTSLKFT
jgi:hypothetical protein